MKPSLRQSMASLHTWAGVLFSALLFSIFWMGSLSVFDREIDQWMSPPLRLAPPTETPSIDRTVIPLALSIAPDAPAWFIALPNARMPATRLGYRGADGEFTRRYVDSTSGAVLADAGSQGGTGFIFPFHYSLHLKWKDIGYWLVGVAGMAMLVLLVSGVIIHKKIFREFFTFRPHKQRQRASLDLHNLTGVLALPFHFMIALSGLFIFFAIYFPWPSTLAYQGSKEAMRTDVFGLVERPRSGTPAPLASVDAMVRDAELRWAQRHGAPVRVDNIRITHPGDAAGLVHVRSIFPADAVGMDRALAVYDAATGALIRQHEAAPVRRVHAFFAGFHFVQFDHWTIRWLYFISGLSGCVLIATGMLFWIEARRERHRKLGLRGVDVVRSLAVGTVTGIILANLVYFVANRLLPADAAFGGMNRAQLEIRLFFLAWLLTFAHAWLVPARALAQQCGACAVAAVAAVAANAVTTGGLFAWSPGSAAAVWMDLALLLLAAIAALAARRMAQRAAPSAKPAPARPLAAPLASPLDARHD